MLDYLNNQQNRKAHPNENYARELMELFTLGIGNYTENDIREAARAFTGWAHDGDEFIFRKYDHDDGERNSSARRGNFDGDDVIDIILQHQACAKYIAGRLLELLRVRRPRAGAASTASAQLLREIKWEMRPLLRTIFTSQAFYSDKAIGSQIKSPIQLVVGTIRMLGLDDAADARADRRRSTRWARSRWSRRTSKAGRAGGRGSTRARCSCVTTRPSGSPAAAGSADGDAAARAGGRRSSRWPADANFAAPSRRRCRRGRRSLGRRA